MKQFTLTLCSLMLLAGTFTARAQWVTQTINLKSGWNAVYLHVDPSYDTLDNLVGNNINNPILEVWLWAPPATTLQFVQSPQLPVEGAQWMSWVRNSENTQMLQRMIGNSAYLVRSSSDYTWTIKGKPLPPSYDWTTTGMNFLGFPSVSANPPTFESFLAKNPQLQLNAEIYQYNGGELGAGNPARLYALRTSTVKRGQAYWIRSGTVYNKYFAPFELALSGARGLDFGDVLNSASFRVRNLTSTNVTITLSLVASEAAPSGQTNLSGTPPLVVRGDLNTTNLTYSYTNLNVGGTRSWTLAAQGQSGSEVEIVLGLDRVTMGGSVGDSFGGILRLTDSFGFSQVEFPVTAKAASRAGLWVGAASVTQVGQYLKSYSKSGDQMVMDTNGQYIVTGVNTNLGEVGKAFPLRLIIHNPEVGQGSAVLMQHVFVGVDAWTNPIVALQESSLNAAYLSASRRISATHLPWTATNQVWAFDGTLGDSATLTATVSLPFNDQASNPFLHTYHPDHDNLDTSFKNELPQGSESYTVKRTITLQFVPAAGSDAAFSSGGQTLSGYYFETINVEGLARSGGTHDTRTFQIRGSFILNRISSIPTLTAP